jgi:hypothetical protein
MVTCPVTIIPAAVGPPATGVPHGPAPALRPAAVVTPLPEPLPPDPLMAALPEDTLMPLPEDALMPLPDGPLMPLPEFVPDPPPEGEVPLVPIPEDALITLAPETAPAPEVLLPLTMGPGAPVSPPHPDANAASSTGNANR